MTVKFRELIPGVVLLALAAALHLASRQIVPRIRMGVDSGFFPEIATALLAALSLVIIARAFARSDVQESDGEPRNYPRVALTCAAITAYAAAVPLAGFIAASILYLPLQFALLAPRGRQTWPMYLAIATASALVIHTVFSSGFGLILPSGPF